MPLAKKKKINPRWYLLGAFNLLPIIVFMLGNLSGKHLAYFYWGECAFIAAITLAIYLRHIMIFMVLSAAIGVLVYSANPYMFVSLQGIGVFWSIYSICWISYIEVGRSSYGQYMKKKPPKSRFFIYLLFLCSSLAFCFVLTNLVSPNWIPSGDQASQFYMTMFTAAILVPSISIGILKVTDMIGQKHFFEYMVGTYHNPIERVNIVLFLDMVGSSSIAEKLSPYQSMDLIAQFIYDCSYIFRIHGGDIINYTGDGLVVLWPINRGNSALSAAHRLRALFSSKEGRSRYWRQFGMVPDFRIGIHAGKIVLSQIGEEKLFIGLYGDVVNTAARLEQMNKELDTKILLSAQVAGKLNQSWKSILKPLGEREVRGRVEKIKVFTLYDEV